MLHPNDDRTVSALTATVLDTLRKNLEEHKLIVAEAKAGYVRKATEALISRLAQIQAGAVPDLRFSLTPPESHTKDYETVIKMLELHFEAGEKTIQLKAADVQKYVLNDWTWTDTFLTSNAGYSDMSRAIARGKGLSV